MDQITIDREPAPVTLTERIEALQPGESLLAGDRSRSTVASLATRLKGRYPGREYRTADTIHGPRVWRTA